MINQLSRLALGDARREELQGYDSDFPYTAIIGDMDRYDGRWVPWHWHEPFEFNMVARGTIEISTERNVCSLNAGEGVLINSNALHTMRASEGMLGSAVHAQLFDRSVIAATGLASRRYVGPIAACTSLDMLIFSPKDAKQREILDLMARAFSAAEAEPPGFELEICGLLSQVWQRIYVQARPIIEMKSNVDSVVSERIKCMLTYIRAHFEEEITPKGIAEAASICERECFRCFRQVLGTTPAAVLTDFRASKAAEMLVNTDKSVTEIALSCGFNTAGYFGKVFRKKMGLTPGEYRKRGR